MIKIFIDFDGTITLQDVGDAMFEKFGGDRCLEYIEEYREGLISAVECFRQECVACGVVDRNELDAFLSNQTIDFTFVDFLNFSRERNFNCFILSDGMDYYIRRILNHHSIYDVPLFTNHLELVPVDGVAKVLFKPDFPYTDEDCDRCANCKRNHILTLCADDDIIVYIGEGYSDRCPARYADIVFAKDELLKYCQMENISYYEYQIFSDVTQRMKMLFPDKQGPKQLKFRKRRRAQLAAREVFLGG